MAEATGLNEILQYNPELVQGVANLLVFIFLGAMLGLGILFLMWKVYQSMTYNKRAVIHTKVGKTELTTIDHVKEVEVEGEKLFHYLKMKKYSPRFDSKYMRIFQTKTLLGGTKSKVGFVAYMYDDKLIPCTLKEKTIEPFDYDGWNYLITRLRINQEKYTKTNALMQMMPYIALGAVIMAFIVGSMLWGQHVETVSLTILDRAAQFSEQMLTKSGAVQTLT